MAVMTEATLTAALEAEIIAVYTATVPVFVDREILDRSLANVKKGFRQNWRDGSYQPS